MNLFTYEEQGERKYLVYEKRAGEDMDFLTLEMISNNTIEGVAPSAYIQIDDKLLVKYDITGLNPLREHLQGTVGRRALLDVLEAIADAAMEAEDYMLTLSSYVMDEDYIYVDPATMKIFMIVLPIVRKGDSVEMLLKRLLMEVQYDQSEDCSYVAALLNLFGRSGTFSIPVFKAQVSRLKKEKARPAAFEDDHKAERKEEQKGYQDTGQGGEQRADQKKDPEEPKRRITISKEERDQIVHELKRQHDLDVLFSAEEEMFPKKEKKRHFWQKLLSREKKETKDIPDVEAAIAGIAIPGTDIPAILHRDTDWNGEDKIPSVAIPIQNVEIERRNIEKQDFGETEFIGGEDGDGDDETQFIGMEPDIAETEFVLCRLRTGERFHIRDEITRVGRSSSVSEICISGNKGVGRVHALIYIREGQAFIEDNNSKNKTYVDNVRLKPGEPPHRLENGSKIRMGDEELEFYIQK